MAKLEGKLPFVDAIYQCKLTGKKIKVISRTRKVGGGVLINYRYERSGVDAAIEAYAFYKKFKRCKEGTAFHIEEGWNE